MSDLFGNHIVGFPTRRLRIIISALIICIITYFVYNVWHYYSVVKQETNSDLVMSMKTIHD